MYEYQKEKPGLLTDKGQASFIRNRDLVMERISENGAVRLAEAMAGFVGGDSWFYLACFDRMVELGDLMEVTEQGKVAGQHRVFVRARS